MSSLTDIEKRYLEKLLAMSSGYLLLGPEGRLGEPGGRAPVIRVSVNPKLLRRERDLSWK